VETGVIWANRGRKRRAEGEKGLGKRGELGEKSVFEGVEGDWSSSLSRGARRQTQYNGGGDPAN